MKEHCIDIVQRAGIALPPMYALGFRNNKCIPCVKAQSAAYWALMRREFPQQFDRMARLSRELGVKLCQTGGAGGRERERLFIDEIPLDQTVSDPIQPSFDFLCHLAEQDLSPPMRAPT